MLEGYKGRTVLELVDFIRQARPQTQPGEINDYAVKYLDSYKSENEILAGFDRWLELRTKGQRSVSVWYLGEDPSLYPMVLIRRGKKSIYYYQISNSSLKRLIRAIPYTAKRMAAVGFDGWSVQWNDFDGVL